MDLIVLLSFILIFIGIWIISRRDSSWRQTEFWNSVRGLPSERTRAWDQYQILIGSAFIVAGISLVISGLLHLTGYLCLVPFGIGMLVALTIINHRF